MTRLHDGQRPLDASTRAELIDQVIVIDAPSHIASPASSEDAAAPWRTSSRRLPGSGARRAPVRPRHRPLHVLTSFPASPGRSSDTSATWAGWSGHPGQCRSSSPSSSGSSSESTRRADGHLAIPTSPPGLAFRWGRCVGSSGPGVLFTLIPGQTRCRDRADAR